MDSSRFKNILIPLSPVLYSRAYKILRDEDIAKDMVQETYITLWNRRDSLDELSNIESFAVRILRNKCIDYLRTLHLYKGIDEADDVADTCFSAEDIYNDTQQLSRVMEKLNLLPNRQKQILVLRCVKELTLEEIATLTGLSNINVRTLLSRARKRLREICELEFKEV